MSSRGIAGALVALLLTGCSADAEPPTSLPPITGSPAATTPAPLPTPSGMNEATVEGANAFTRHWFAELNAAFTSRDSSRLLALSTPTCNTCKNFAGVVEALADDGERVTGGEVSLIFVEASPIEPDGVVLDIAFSRSASTRRGSDGQIVATAPPAARQLAQVKLIRVGPSWRFAGMQLVEL